MHAESPRNSKTLWSLSKSPWIPVTQIFHDAPGCMACCLTLFCCFSWCYQPSCWTGLCSSMITNLPWISDLVSAIKTCWVMVDTKPWAIRNMMRFFFLFTIPGCSLISPRLARGQLEWGPLGLGLLLSSAPSGCHDSQEPEDIVWGSSSHWTTDPNSGQNQLDLWQKKTSRNSKSFELKKSFRIYVTGTWFGVRSSWTTTSFSFLKSLWMWGCRGGMVMLVEPELYLDHGSNLQVPFQI